MTPDLDELLEMHRLMATVRAFEETVAVLYSQSEIAGFVHLSVGQEAVAVGACRPLRSSDCIVSTHRGHGHCIAKGMDCEAMFAELMGRATGSCGGLGGSMHIADLDVGVLGANGIVAAGLPIAAGAAAAIRQRGEDSVVVAFFGDGAVAQGAFHEALNLAALWSLPVLFLCENNGFAEFTAAEQQHRVPVWQRAAAYGVAGEQVDGGDVVAVRGAVEAAVCELRAGRGPRLLEAVTRRGRGHYEGDQQRYREDSGALAEWDPLTVSAQRIDGLGGAERRRQVESEAQSAVAAALRRARTAPLSPPTAYLQHVLRPRAVVEEATPAARGRSAEPDEPEEFRYMDGVREALRAELRDDGSVWLAGIDVAAGGNVFGITRGLADEFPGRVLDTPIAETAILGLAVGGAMAGTRPVVEVMYLDFIGVCFDQLLNQAAKLPFMTGGKARMALVVRTQFGAGRSSGSQHSQSLEALLAHIPGLTVAMPSTPADAYGLLRAAIRDPNPVVVIEHRLLYGRRGPRPSADHVVPLGRGVIRRPGTDVTVVAWSRMAHEALTAAEQVAADGVSAEVIDLRTVAPFDEELVVESVARTGRLLVAHEAVRSGGLGAEIAARVADRCITALDAPVRRVAAPDSPAPYAPHMEAAWLPGSAQIAAALRELAAY